MKNQNIKSRRIELITLDTALEAVKVAISAGRKLGVNISISICDAMLTEIAYAHDDNATAHSAFTSRRKAQTAASTRKATGWMNSELAITLPMASGNILTNIPGGMPIHFGKILVGALGIAGGTVEQDAEIARAVLKGIGADLV
ncbi:MAG: heme-binding protein [bacterium]